jgi:hypothetical protein
MSRVLRIVVIAVLLCAGARTARAELIVTVNYTGDPLYAPAFTSAAQIWENLLVGYQSGLVVQEIGNSSYNVGQTVSNVFITANVAFIDGPGGVLGSAGPTNGVIDALDFVLATDGVMNFDSADVANLLGNGSWQNVILHEMAHVLGFGTLWVDNGVYTTGTGEFLGANATAAWQTDFNQPDNPNVELGGGPGTANGHWNEVDFGGSLTGIIDGLNRDMRDELMTGWLNPNSFISDMTVASFIDIGFTGVESVPEPGSCLLASLGLGGLVLRGRRRHREKNTA